MRKIIIYYGKENQYGTGDIDTVFEEFDNLDEAQKVLSNIADYITPSYLTDWADVKKGDWLEFHLYEEIKSEDEDDESIFIDCNTYNGVIKDFLGKTNR